MNTPRLLGRRRLLTLGLLVACGGVAVHVESGAGTPAWKALAPLASGPRQETAVVALGGRIYVLGGFDGDKRVLDTVEAYDPARDRWEARKPLPMPLHHANAAAVGTKLYVPNTRTWSPRRPMLTPRAGCVAGVVADRIIVAGGEGNGRRPDGVFVETEAYHPASDAWTTLPPMLTPRHGAAALGGKLYVPGGATRQGFGAVAANEVLEPPFDGPGPSRRITKASAKGTSTAGAPPERARLREDDWIRPPEPRNIKLAL